MSFLKSEFRYGKDINHLLFLPNKVCPACKENHKNYNFKVRTDKEHFYYVRCSKTKKKIYMIYF